MKRQSHRPASSLGRRKDEKIAELERKVGQLTMDNEILKKASHSLKSRLGGSAV